MILKKIFKSQFQMNSFYRMKTLTPKHRGNLKTLSFYSFFPVCNDNLQISEREFLSD